MPNFGTKNALFGYFWTGILKNFCGYFWTGILKNFCHLLIQQPRICLIAKFCAKTKILIVGTKNASFGCFG